MASHEQKGVREAPRYCNAKGRNGFQCKRGFPKKVLCDKFHKPRRDKYLVRIVCKGVAQELQLPVNGKRNMLGTVMGKRRCGWMAPTSLILSHVFRSNTNVQTNYRVPITRHTHDRDCSKTTCMDGSDTRKMLLLCQRAMTQMTGYFGPWRLHQQETEGWTVRVEEVHWRTPFAEAKVRSQRIAAKCSIGSSHEQNVQRIGE